MFRKLLTFVMALVLIFAFTLLAEAASKDMWAYVYSWDGGYNADGTLKMTRITSGITFKVLQAGSDTAETLTEYNDDTATSLTNPVTTTSYNSATICNDMVSFRVDPGESGDENVDLIVVNTDGGYTAKYEDFNQYVHTILIDQRMGVMHMGTVWFTLATTNEVDTGIDFDYDSAVHHVDVEAVSIVSSLCSIDVGLLSSGTSGDADGFINNQTIGTAAYHDPTKPTVTVGSTCNYISAVPEVGVLLGTTYVGTDNNYKEGIAFLWDHMVKGADEQSLTYTVTSADGAAYGGYINYWFTRVRP